MSKITFQRQTTRRVLSAAPTLKYIAFYHGTEERLNACMRDYADRSFVYILSAVYENEEFFLYVGKSKAQYARCLTHSKKFAYDHIYLFESDPESLTANEVAVIKELKPLFNRSNNPELKSIELLQIDREASYSREMIQHYLRMYSNYKQMGLYGFALPRAIFATLENISATKGCTCSDLLQQILEKELYHTLTKGLNNLNDKESNLTTTTNYAIQHGKSQEQIKQYLHQKGRIVGAVKIGRDWLIPQDSRIPEVIYRKKTKP